jgi:hypothetical protein
MELSSTEKESIERALRDVSDIKLAIDRVGRGRKFGGVTIPSKLHLIIHLVLSVNVFTLILLEIFRYPSMTEVLYYTYILEDLRWICIGVIGLVLVTLVSAFYIAVRRAARKEGEEFSSFISRNFVYLQNLSFISDLLLKFIVIALVMVAKRPDWVASILLMFTGDYLIQGRLFILPLRTALLCGVLCILSGIIQLMFFNGELVYAFAAFFLVSAMSARHIHVVRKHSQELEE